MKFYRIEYDDAFKKEKRGKPWACYMEPRRVAPHMWHVSGHYDLGDYIIDTGDGLIMIDTPTPEMAYLMIDSIWRAGFDPRDIKLLLLSHYHFDHDGCARMIQEMSGCKIYMSKEDWEEKIHPSRPNEVNMVMPYTVDEFYADDKPITLGNITIKTVMTPGHTPGVTSFFFDDTDEETGETFHVGMHGGIGIDDMRPSFMATGYGATEERRDRFIDQCLEMSRWDIDITIPSHMNQCGMAHGFTEDRNDYHSFVDDRAWPVMLLERRARVMAFRAGDDANIPEQMKEKIDALMACKLEAEKGKK